MGLLSGTREEDGEEGGGRVDGREEGEVEVVEADVGWSCGWMWEESVGVELYPGLSM